MSIYKGTTLIAGALPNAANQDLSNLSSTGEKHFLNKSQVSNCILEAPNGIITYSGNTLTLKAGVKVLIPNGRNSDRTLNNIEVTVANDKTYTLTSNLAGRQRQPIFISIDENLQYGNISNGAYYVTDSSTSGTYDANYSIKNNTMKITRGTASSWQTVQWAYIGWMSIDSNLNITSVHIEQPIIINNALVESYVNGTSWYRVYSDGWIEQGGSISSIPNNSTSTISLLKSFSNTNYSVMATLNWSGVYTNHIAVTNKQTSTFQLFNYRSSGNDAKSLNATWYACGY